MSSAAQTSGRPPGGGVLVVTAHPDDETLIAGGTLSACAAAGLHTAVVCLTRGEYGPIASRRLAARSTLGAVRRQELRAACAELGVEWVRCYRRQDAHLPWTDASSAARQLAGVISMLRPRVVLTFGEDGLYDHPDHVAALDFTRRALRRLPDPPPLYRSLWPRAMTLELVGELQRRGLPDDLWGIEPEDFGTEQVPGAIKLDVRQFVAAKMRALRAHRTQLARDHAFAALPDDLAARFLGWEWFVPPASGDRWLAGVVAVRSANG